MYNTKFILYDGKEVYPGYLTTEMKKQLKQQCGDKAEVLRCGCKPSENLFYKISEDYKIYPAHNNYVHDKYCCRYKDASGKSKRQTAYIINEEDGEVTVYLGFNPKIFNAESSSSGDNKDKEQTDTEQLDDSNLEEIIIGKKSKNEVKESVDKEPSLSLEQLVRSINVDSFTEKVLNNKIIDSKEKFSKYVYFRMKKVKVSGMKKMLGELSLERDGVSFFYLPVSDIIKKNMGEFCAYYLNTIGPEGKIYTNHVNQKAMESALKKFAKQYNTDPDQNTMAAGFQYIKKGRNKKCYRIIGRIHLFQVSDIGIYCRSLAEKNVFDKLNKITQKNSNIKFWIPPEDESISAVIDLQKSKKLLMLFQSNKDEPFVYDTTRYVPLIMENDITEENMYNILN